jgi:hypothetical protein
MLDCTVYLAVSHGGSYILLIFPFEYCRLPSAVSDDIV